ncbi:MAG: hydrogenase maturation nickel metallochaperone HypA [Planctomycetota bacterium]
MHEASLMESALDIAVEHARRNSAARIVRMTLGVGVLSGVDPRALEIAFAEVVCGTIAEGATLSIESQSGDCCCKRCECRFATTELLPSCPECDGTDISILSGQDLQLLSLEVA